MNNVQDLMQQLAAASTDKKTFADALATVDTVEGNRVQVQLTGPKGASPLFLPKAALRTLIGTKLLNAEEDLALLKLKLESVNQHLRTLV